MGIVGSAQNNPTLFPSHKRRPLCTHSLFSLSFSPLWWAAAAEEEGRVRLQLFLSFGGSLEEEGGGGGRTLFGGGSDASVNENVLFLVHAPPSPPLDIYSTRNEKRKQDTPSKNPKEKPVANWQTGGKKRRVFLICPPPFLLPSFAFGGGGGGGEDCKQLGPQEFDRERKKGKKRRSEKRGGLQKVNFSSSPLLSREGEKSKEKGAGK